MKGGLKPLKDYGCLVRLSLTMQSLISAAVLVDRITIDILGGLGLVSFSALLTWVEVLSARWLADASILTSLVVSIWDVSLERSDILRSECCSAFAEVLVYAAPS